MSIQKAQAEITSFEFMEWIAYLDVQLNTVTKQDHYLATIAAEVRRSWVGEDTKLKIEASHFYIKYVNKVVEKIKKTVNWKTRMAQSKAFWGALTGTKGK